MVFQSGWRDDLNFLPAGLATQITGPGFSAIPAIPALPTIPTISSLPTLAGPFETGWATSAATGFKAWTHGGVRWLWIVFLQVI